MSRPELPLAGLVGIPAREAVARLGRPDADRRVGGDRWIVFRSGDVTLRLRCRSAETPGASESSGPLAAPSSGGSCRGDGTSPRTEAEVRVASWTASFARGRESLRGAAEPLGLWPAAAPDARPGPAGRTLRRPLREPSGAVRSLTAEVRGGRIRRLAVWDEVPEWLEGGVPTGDGATGR